MQTINPVACNPVNKIDFNLELFNPKIFSKGKSVEVLKKVISAPVEYSKLYVRYMKKNGRVDNKYWSFERS